MEFLKFFGGKSPESEPGKTAELQNPSGNESKLNELKADRDALQRLMQIPDFKTPGGEDAKRLDELNKQISDLEQK